jgi:hypothetical protein
MFKINLEKINDKIEYKFKISWLNKEEKDIAISHFKSIINLPDVLINIIIEYYELIFNCGIIKEYEGDKIRFLDYKCEVRLHTHLYFELRSYKNSDIIKQHNLCRIDDHPTEKNIQEYRNQYKKYIHSSKISGAYDIINYLIDGKTKSTYYYTYYYLNDKNYSGYNAIDQETRSVIYNNLPKEDLTSIILVPKRGAEVIIIKLEIAIFKRILQIAHFIHGQMSS